MSESAGFTRETIKSMSVEDLKRIVKDPVKLQAYNSFLQTREGAQVVAEIMSEADAPPVGDDVPPVEIVDNPAVAEFNQAEVDAQAAAQAAAQTIAEAQAIADAQAAAQAAAGAI